MNIPLEGEKGGQFVKKLSEMGSVSAVNVRRRVCLSLQAAALTHARRKPSGQGFFNFSPGKAVSFPSKENFFFRAD